MAKTGLKGIIYAKMKAGEKSYEKPKSIGKGVSATVSPNSSSAKLYADDVMVESDSSFSDAGVSLTLDDDRNDIMAELLGHELNSEEVIRKAGDVAPYVGIGRIVTKIVNNVRAYKVEFLTKVKFKEPNQDEATKAESVEFKTVTLEGVAIANADGVWSKTKTFATEQEATAYLTACFNQEA